MGGTCVGVVAVADVVSIKVSSDEDASAFLDVVALITDDTSELIVVAKETIDGMFSERYAVVGASAIISVAVEPIVASASTVDGVAAVPLTVSIAVVFVDEVAVGDADLVDPMSRVFVDDVFADSNDVIAVMTEAVDGVIPSVFVVVIGLFGVITVDGVDVAVFVTDALAVSILVT